MATAAALRPLLPPLDDEERWRDVDELPPLPPPLLLRCLLLLTASKRVARTCAARERAEAAEARSETLNRARGTAQEEVRSLATRVATLEATAAAAEEAAKVASIRSESEKTSLQAHIDYAEERCREPGRDSDDAIPLSRTRVARNSATADPTQLHAGVSKLGDHSPRPVNRAGWPRDF